MSEQDLTYHRERVQAELDWAYRAAPKAAADAHLRLAALHMQQLKRVDELCDGSGLAGASFSRDKLLRG